MKIKPSSDYIQLLKKTLIDFNKINKYEYSPLHLVPPSWKIRLLSVLDSLLRTRNFALCKRKYIEAEKRLNGYDWPIYADTMIGLKRLDNIEYCMRSILKEGIAGDFMETGVWRGGATILMRAILKEEAIEDRKVWLADSFEGLPKPNAKKYSWDRGNKLHELNLLKVSLDEVKENFKKYDLLDDQVCFLKGWFKDTLPTAPVKKLALLRLDGDLYESTILALEHLYPKLSKGGYLIVDDYNAFEYCQRAVDDYRAHHAITAPIVEIDGEAIYWQKAK